MSVQAAIDKFVAEHPDVTPDECWPYWEISFLTSKNEDTDLLVWGFGSWQEAHDYAMKLLGHDGESACRIVNADNLCHAGLDFDEAFVLDAANLRKLLTVPSPHHHVHLAELHVTLKGVTW